MALQIMSFVPLAWLALYQLSHPGPAHKTGLESKNILYPIVENLKKRLMNSESC